MTQDTEKSIERETLRLRNPYVPPHAGLETQMADVFSQIMGVTPVGAEDDFYDLGGDSLLGEQISMEILRVTGKVFPISGLFENGTPRAVAAALSSTPGDAPALETRDTFFIVHGRGGYTVPRPAFMSGLISGARLVIFEFPGIRGNEPFPRNIGELARVYADQIDRDQPEGPVRLVAFCSGGLIALEMVALLEKRGRPLEALVLLDPGLPRSLAARHRLTMRLRQNPSSLLSRLMLLLHTGRLSLDRPFMEPLWIRSQAVANWIEAFRKRIGKPGGRRRYANVGLQRWPKSWLIASYRHAWPKPSLANSHILASRLRSEDYFNEHGVWQHLLPNRKVHVIVDRHQEILDGNSAPVAAAMEALLLGRELPARTAPTEAAGASPSSDLATAMS